MLCNDNFDVFLHQATNLDESSTGAVVGRRREYGMDRRVHQRRLPMDEFDRRALCVRERNKPAADAPVRIAWARGLLLKRKASEEGNAGAVIDDTYYYGKNVGKSGTESDSARLGSSERDAHRLNSSAARYLTTRSWTSRPSRSRTAPTR